jgi:hypothetical protein
MEQASPLICAHLPRRRLARNIRSAVEGRWARFF